MTSLPLQKKTSQQNEAFIDWVYVPIIFLAILLLGNYGLFLGHTFFTDENVYTIFRFASENMKSSGWRPDLGLGISYFYGDPGTFHTWSLFRWWNHLFSDPLLGFNSSIIFFLWAACLAQYIILRKIAPNLGKITSVALACMVAFGPLRYRVFFYQSYWGMFPVVVPVISLLLYSFSQKPSPKHYFIYTLTLTLSLILGSSITLLQAIFFGISFFLILTFFHGWHKNGKVFRVWIWRFFILNTTAGISILILSGWTFYSIFLESGITGYVRDATYGAGSFFTFPSIKLIFQRLLDYIQLGIFSPWSSTLGIQQTLIATGKNCFSIIFPLIVLILIIYKARGFWELAIKSLILGAIIYQELNEWFPGFTQLLQNTFGLRPPINFESVLHIFGILGAGVCLNRMLSGDFDIKRVLFIRILSLALFCLYLALFIVALFSIYSPEILTDVFLNLWAQVAIYIQSQSLIQLAPTLIKENVILFHETLGISSLFFYGSSFAILFLFTTRRALDFVKWKGGCGLAVFLLINQVFLSWAIYPLNKEPLIWEQQVSDGSPLANRFSPTDRIMRVGWPNCRDTEDYFKCINDKFFERELGVRRWTPGYMGTPALELSAAKSFTQKEVDKFIKAFIKKENPDWDFPYGLNRLLQRDPPIYSSKFYDITGVTYLAAQDPLPENNRLKLIYANHQFFLYQYLDAWPYFYLADRIETISKYEDLYNAEKGIAYLWNNEPSISLRSENPNGGRFIKLKKFDFGVMEFEFSSDREEFLVISDAWHPYWHATVNNQETKILKTNGVFKGIALPSGQGTLELFFDNSPYKPGVWISVTGWVLFLGGWLFYIFKAPPLNPDNSTSKPL